MQKGKNEPKSKRNKGKKRAGGGEGNKLYKCRSPKNPPLNATKNKKETKRQRTLHNINKTHKTTQANLNKYTSHCYVIQN